MLSRLILLLLQKKKRYLIFFFVILSHVLCFENVLVKGILDSVSIKVEWSNCYALFYQIICKILVLQLSFMRQL